MSPAAPTTRAALELSDGPFPGATMPRIAPGTLQALASCLLLQATILATGNALLSRLDGPSTAAQSAANHRLK